jgi:hypothetical protein
MYVYLQQWDVDLADIAQKWASNCQTAHDANYARYIPGQYVSGQLQTLHPRSVGQRSTTNATSQVSRSGSQMAMMHVTSQVNIC